MLLILLIAVVVGFMRYRYRYLYQKEEGDGEVEGSSVPLELKKKLDACFYLFSDDICGTQVSSRLKSLTQEELSSESLDLMTSPVQFLYAKYWSEKPKRFTKYDMKLIFELMKDRQAVRWTSLS